MVDSASHFEIVIILFRQETQMLAFDTSSFPPSRRVLWSKSMDPDDDFAYWYFSDESLFVVEGKSNLEDGDDEDPFRLFVVDADLLEVDPRSGRSTKIARLERCCSQIPLLGWRLSVRIPEFTWFSTFALTRNLRIWGLSKPEIRSWKWEKRLRLVPKDEFFFIFHEMCIFQNPIQYFNNH